MGRALSVRIAQGLLLGGTLFLFSYPEGGYERSPSLSWLPGSPNPNWEYLRRGHGVPIRWFEITYGTSDLRKVSGFVLFLKNPVVPVFAVSFAWCVPLLRRKVAPRYSYPVVFGAICALTFDGLLMDLDFDYRVAARHRGYIFEAGVIRPLLSMIGFAFGVFVIQLRCAHSPSTDLALMRPPHGADGASAPSA